MCPSGSLPCCPFLRDSVARSVRAKEKKDEDAPPPTPLERARRLIFREVEQKEAWTETLKSASGLRERRVARGRQALTPSPRLQATMSLR